MHNKSLAATFAAIALALLASCSNPLTNKAAIGPATGNLALTFAGMPVVSGARTIVPAPGDLPALASYDVVVSRALFADRTATFLSATGSVSGLEPGGPWTVAVSGKTEGGLVVATGSASVTIALPGPTAATVNLDYVAAAAGAGNTGAMAITLLFPKTLVDAGASGVEATLDGVALSPALSVADNGDSVNDKVVYAASGITSASSQLIINLKKGGVLVLPWAEQVWVYRNITTTKIETLVAAAFSAAPAAPASLSASLQATGTVSLSWTNVGTAESYALERSADEGGSWTVVNASLAAASTSATNSVPITETYYDYRISATNTFGTSAYSASATVQVTPAFIVAYDKANVSLSYASGDSASSVTKDLTLVSSPTAGTTVSWASDNTAVISNAGAITRPNASDATGNLTATISRGGASDTTVVFALTVKPTGTGGITITSPSAPAAADLVFRNAGNSPISSFIVIKGTPVTVNTSLSGASYSWYADNAGATISTAQSCAVDPATLSLGAHVLSLAAVSGGKTYSGRLPFTVYQHPGVLFEANGGSGAMALLVIPNGGSLALTANAFTKTGYSFAGWATSSGGAVAYAGGASYSMASAVPVTLYAKWTAVNYTITYNLDSGVNGSNPATYTILTADINLAAATRAGYSFAGWYSDAGLTTAVTTIAAGSTGNVGLWAKWTGNSYTVTFDGQSGSSPSPASVSATCGSTYGTLATTSRSGYSFGGWYTGTGGTGTLISAGSAVAITAATTLYAKWTGNSYTVTFDGQTGTAPSPASISVTYASSYGTLATSTLSGYAFAGWWTVAGGTGSQVTSSSTVAITADQSLYAKWTKGPFTFTNAGQTGRLGPSQSQLDLAYASTTLAGYVTATGTGIQRWVVPATGSYRIEAYGAQGSASSGYGQGAVMKGDVALTVGDVLWILVGQMGAGGLYDPGNVGAYGHPSGGGGSFVAKGAALASSTAVMVAGGGGGDYGPNADSGGSVNTNGNQGYGGGNGGTGGGAGMDMFAGMYPAAGFSGSSTGANSFLDGGQGALGPTTSYYWNGDGGFGGGGAMYGQGYSTAGGGGGYSGGGSASPTNGTTMYAGGGGSWNAGTSQSNTAGANAGMGRVVITLY